MDFKKYLNNALKDIKLKNEYVAKPVDFFIHQRPTHISFDCPFCDIQVKVEWECIDEPEYWGDDWGYVECPYCEETVKLGDYDI